MQRTRQGNKLGRSCVIEERHAALSGDFGMSMLHAKFPELADEILVRLGAYTRGPRKGLARGYVTWTKVVEGGWHYERGCVLRPGTCEWDALGAVGQALHKARIARRAAFRQLREDDDPDGFHRSMTRARTLVRGARELPA